MAEAESKRQRRTPQERANELDEKITKINQSINELEEKKKTVVEQLLESGGRRLEQVDQRSEGREDHRSKGTHQISGGKKAGDPCSQGSPKAP